MNTFIGIILIIYTVFHAIFKIGGLGYVMFQLYITKTKTMEDIKQASSIFATEFTLWYSLVEHIVMTFVFIYAITVLL